MLRRLLPLLLLALVGCATVKPALPQPPRQAELVADEPIPCPNGTLYLHVFDTNPDTKAAVIVVGPAENGHNHGEPFLVVVIDDAGDVTLNVLRNGQVKAYTEDQFRAEFGGVGPSAACAVRPGVGA